MDPRAAVDGFRPPWSGFADFFRARTDVRAPYLTELHHARGTRREWTVGAWRARVEATAGWLRERGIGPGDAVATLAGNTAEALALAYGSWIVGACCVPLNAQESVDRQAFVLRDAAARLLVYAPEHADRARALTGRSGVPLHHTDELPAEDAAADRGQAPAATGLDLAALRLYTSGTTGEPKGIITTVGNLLTDLDALALVFGWDRATRVYTVLPVHHANALVISSLLPWHTGASTVLADRFRTEVFWSDVAAERATTASLVPTLLEFLLAGDDAPPPCFAEVLCGAGPLLVETALAFEKRFGVPVRHIYGLSETTCVACAMPALPAAQRRRWHADFGFPSIGGAVPHARMAVLDPVTGGELPAGERGELAVRGAIVMRGYANRPDATAEALRDGWFHTGDEGFWQPGPDRQPAYFITGRIKELIIRGGHNISPFEIDEVLCSHPRVRFALAVPFEHRIYGDEIAAYVVPDGPLAEQDVLDHCAARLDFAHQPKVVVFGDDVPYTVTGKAKRLELKARLAARLSAHRDTTFRRPRAPATDATGAAVTPEELDVPVAGGTLRVCRWPGRGPVVLAAHGITANALSFAPVAAALAGRATLVAADLRGRARSADLPGPYGLAAHADDLIAVLDRLDLDRAPVVGHSMGAFVAAVAAVRHPDRVSSVLLVDGGVALAVPAGADIDAILQAVIGPAMQRLRMTFESTQGYLDFWRAHPALAAEYSPAVEAYALRDLTGEPPTLRSSCSLEAVRRDATDTLLDPATTTAVHNLPCPATLLWCERGILDEPRGLYDDVRLDAAGLDRGRVTVARVPGVNHYTVLLSPGGAATVADHVARLA